MTRLEQASGVRRLRADDADWTVYAPREAGGAGSLDYGEDGAGAEGLSSVHWLRERHLSSLGVPLSAGLFRMEPSAFDFDFVAEETMHLLSGEVEVAVAGEEPLALRAGDLAFFPAGVRTHWRVLAPTVLFFTLLD